MRRCLVLLALLVLALPAAAQSPRFTALLEAAQAGGPADQQRVGHALEWGEGVSADPVAALAWYRRAAAAGSVRAMVDAATLLPPAEALPLLRRAAAAGEPDGLVRLAMALEWGTGTAADACGAATLYARAAERGSAMAPVYLHLMLQRVGEAPCAPVVG